MQHYYDTVIKKKINDKGYYEFYLALSTKLTSY